jgi:hypothetical protein
MSNPLTLYYDKQYTRFLEELRKNWSVQESALTLLKADLKPIYKRYLGLACAATLVAQRIPRNEYVIALIKACYLSVVLAIKGLENSSYVLARQSIELALKHVFFSGHPVEYKWTQTREDFRELSFQMLIDFVRKTDEIREMEKGSILCDQICSAYRVLSRYVHAHARQFLRYGVSGGERFKSKRTAEIVHKLDQRTRELWPQMIFLLIIYSTNRFTRANHMEQRVIKNALGRELDHALVDYLRRLQLV